MHWGPHHAKPSIMSGVLIHMAATSSTMQIWRLYPETPRLTSRFPPPPLICLVPTTSCGANTHNKEEWNAGNTNMTVREEDVHDRHPVRQGHVSAFPFTPSAVARESLAGQPC